MKSNVKQVDRVQASASRPLTKWTSAALIVSGIVAHLLSVNAYRDPYHDFPIEINYVWQGLGLTLIFVEGVLAYLLKRQQGGMYWFFWLQLKITNPDERQKAARQRIFERAYGLMLIVALLTAMYLTGVAEYDTVARDDIIKRTIWIVGIFIISLPSILAAWQKDS